MKRILVLAVVAFAAITAPANAASIYLGKAEGRHAIAHIIERDTDFGAPFYNWNEDGGPACWRVRINVVKCAVSFYDDYDAYDYVCGAIYRAKVYRSRPNTIYVSHTWDNCS